jgi:hypothetical protein
MRISAVHPAVSMRVSARHTGLNDASRAPSSSLEWYQSSRTPDAVTPKV